MKTTEPLVSVNQLSRAGRRAGDASAQRSEHGFRNARLRLGFMALLASLFIFSCAQDSIFFNISVEVKPKKPRIGGSPTKIVVLDDKLYVGARFGKDIWIFDGGWQKISRPGGSIGELATDGTFLYALVFPGGEPRKASEIMQYDPAADDWVDTYAAPADWSIQSLYCAGGKIFAGAQLKSNYQSYAILYYDPADPTSPLSVVKSNTSFLKGAAEMGGDIYLATAGSGIFKTSTASVDIPADLTDPVEGTANAIITGIITIENTDPAADSVVAVSSGGYVYITPNPDTTAGLPLFGSASVGSRFTGGMGIWSQYDSDSDTWKPALLLMGTRNLSNSQTQGYREMVLNPDGTPSFSVKSTGTTSAGAPSSVSSQPKYDASLGIHAVEAIIQVPNEVVPYPDMTLPENEGWHPLIFASTSQNGLWSYRGNEWNAEP